jgi:pseudouridine-5'-monophosphatase
VFEDAISGVKAGLAAEMHVCWVPDPNLAHHALDGVTMQLTSLEEFDPAFFDLPPFA